VLGYGNPGREDDGLGPAAAEAIEGLRLPGVRTHVNVQLSVEDAADAAEQDWVLFVDAAQSGPEPFQARPVFSGGETAYTSHALSPERLLGICEQVYGRQPRALLVGVRGYAFGFEEELTARARENLDEALRYLRAVITRAAGLGAISRRRPDRSSLVRIPGVAARAGEYL